MLILITPSLFQGEAPPWKRLPLFGIRAVLGAGEENSLALAQGELGRISQEVEAEWARL